MDLWRDKVRPDVRGHSGLRIRYYFSRIIKTAVCIIIFLTIVIITSVVAEADNVYTWLYDVKMIYSEDNITLNLSLEDTSTVPIDKNMGTVLFVLDTYLKNSNKENGKWQMDVNVRDADIIQIGSLNFNQSYTPSENFDITDIYYDTNAFYKPDSRNVRCYKNVESDYVYFYGYGYKQEAVFFVRRIGDKMDKESLYSYLDEISYDDSGNPVKMNFFTYTMNMDTVSGQYCVNDGQWTECDERVKLYYRDYNDGDVLRFRTVFADGTHSGEISHTVNKLKVDVNPDGGSINGKTTMYTCSVDGTYDNNVYIACDNEKTEQFTENVCEKEGFVFGGFAFQEGDGKILIKEDVAYKASVRVKIIPTGVEFTNVEVVDDNIKEQYATKDELFAYFEERYRNLYEGKSFITYYPESVTILSQKQTYFYVSSSRPHVTVKAVWIPMNEVLSGKRITLIKIGSSMYQQAVIRRTIDDDSWFMRSKVDFKNISKAVETSAIRRHIRICPSGEISVLF